MPLSERPRILLIDDDLCFGELMLAVARSQPLTLQYCQALSEMGSPDEWNFDLAIVDYDLENISGLQLIQSLFRCIGERPVVLVSAYHQIERSRWPLAVVEFVNKEQGPQKILEAALRACAASAPGAAQR